jgi:hypothetical protein
MHTTAGTTLLYRGEINHCNGKAGEGTRGKDQRIAVANIRIDAAIMIGIVVHI